ncbi:unnamed protein product [Amaranthus hypochondriacus]
MVVLDLELRKAVVSGDIEFLTKAVASKIPHNEVYFLGHSEDWGSNIFHIAAFCRKVEFLKEALRILPAHLVLQLLSSQQHMYGWNPLHDAVKNGCNEILRLMLGFYKSYSGTLSLVNKPWLALSHRTGDNNIKQTPLDFTIVYGKEDCALEILSMDLELFCGMLDQDGNSFLFRAVQKGFSRVAEKILNSNCSYSLCGQDGSTALHVANRCSENVTKLLLKKHLDCLDIINVRGFNVIQQWAKEGSIGRLELLVDKTDFLADARIKVFSDLMSMKDVDILHLVMMIPNIDFVRVFLEFYQRNLNGRETLGCPTLPWKTLFKNGDSILHMAIYSRLDKHALFFLSLDSTLCDISNNQGETPLLVAIRSGCETVVEKILNLQPNPCYTMLRRNDGRTLLHMLSSCLEEIGTQLLEKYWWMMNLRDDSGRTAFDEAKKENVPWLVKLLENPSLIQKESFDWAIACERNESWAVYAFIDSCKDLQEVCRKEIDTPLHHIKLATYRDYLNFLKIPSISELKNITDREGATPLHRALQREDKLLAKALLIDTEVERNIMDDTGKTAMDLLAKLCEQHDWVSMCKQIKVNPYLKTIYIQPKTNLDQMRNTLSVLAALLATITFAAGFTLPGGINSNNGYAMLAHKPEFMVFLLADAYAMCTSMLVLLCLVWSMISERDMSYFLVDRSVLILMQSLYGTILAFMAGIYVVIAHETLWVAITVLVLCSLIGISVNRTILHNILFTLVPAKTFHTSEKDSTESIDHLV